MSTSFLPHSAFAFTSPTGSPVYPDTPDTSFSFLFPISPPAPHRRAPRPPKASTKRRTGRHIQMREPSQCGLFTVSELPEGTEGASSLYECMEEDFPQDVSGDESMGDCTILQTPSASPSPNPGNGSWGAELTTPLGEGDDPFGAGWTTIPLGGCEVGKDFELAVVDANRSPNTPPQAQPLFAPLKIASFKTTSQPRRPPPLTLTTRFSLPPPSAANSAATPALSGHPFSAISAADSELLTPGSGISPATSTLMPALPIVASGEWSAKCGGSPTTPTRKSWKRHARSDSADAARARKRHSPDDTVDLAMALEELLASCGESVDFSLASSSSGSSASGRDSVAASSSEDDFASKSLRFPIPPSRPVGLGISSPTSHHLFPASPSISSSTGTSPLSLPPRTPRTPEKSSRTYSGSPSTPAHFAPKKPARAHPHSQLPTSFSSLGHASGDSCDRAPSPSSLRGDHSFLTSMSRSESPASSTGSVGSVGSVGSRGSSSLGSASTGWSKRLPGRKGLPMEWRFGQMI